MYLDTDLTIPPTGGDTRADRNIPSALAQFMARIRPWKVLSGSYLDVEELMFFLGLPTDGRSWPNLVENELELALSVGNYFFALSQLAFSVDPAARATASASVIGPAFLSSYLEPPSESPLQVRLTQALAAPQFALAGVANATTVTISGAHAYSAINGTYFIANEPFIELGEHEIVIRPEFFSALLPSVTQLRRGGVALVSGMAFTVSDALSAVLAGPLVPEVTSSTAQLPDSRFTALPGLPNRGHIMGLIRGLAFYEEFLAALVAGYRGSLRGRSVRADHANPLYETVDVLTGYLTQLGRGNFTVNGPDAVFTNFGSGDVLDALAEADLPY